jgi:hypothetical protein
MSIDDEEDEVDDESVDPSVATIDAPAPEKEVSSTLVPPSGG